MSSKIENSITVQRRDTSVPVGVGSARAGFPRPSSNDCSEHMVDTQASVSDVATGVKTSEDVTSGKTGSFSDYSKVGEENNPFKRKGIARTPPNRERVYSCSDIPTRDKEILSAVRNAVTGEAAPSKMNVLEKEEKDVFEKLGKNILTINSIVKEARNIHKTIRDAITAAVVYYQRAQECREALAQTRASEQVNGGTNRPTKALVVKSDKQTQSSPQPEQKDRKNTEGKKRNASSPLDVMPQEKRRVRNPVKRQLSMQSLEAEDQKETEKESGTGWVTVESRKEKKKKREDAEEPRKNQRKRRLPEAVAVKTKTLSYLEALKSIKSKVDPDKLGVKVSGIRQTRGGEILIEIKGGSGGAEGLRGTLAEALGEEATVRTMDKAVTLDIRDIDAITVKEDVERAIKDAIGGSDPGSVKVQALRKGFGQTQVAIVTMSSSAAKCILKAGRLRIGWVLCRVREKIKVLRCYRCLDFGHIARECKGPDHSRACRLCGKDGHIAKNCKEKAFCVVCNRNGQAAQHIPGSKNCEAFQKELKKVKK